MVTTLVKRRGERGMYEGRIESVCVCSREGKGIKD